ncbi:MAG TPA: dienelactone hydrolase family protein [Oculatellaceae cyanobacterium]|jgi:carboxymethylenebutenolidase
MQTVNALRKEWLTIPVNGQAMEAYRVTPVGDGPWPAVIVLMEIFGVNVHIRDVAERLASVGFVAIAPNYYHRTTENLELDYTPESIAIGREHKAKTTREGLLADLKAVIQMLQSDANVAPKDKIGCIGFCFGGHVAYIAAGLPEIAATASFYGAGIPDMSPGGGPPTISFTPEIHGEILCFFGEKDASIPHEQTVMIENALREANVSHEVVRYSQAGHGFCCDRRADYEASAAEDAWHRSLNLFKRRLS